MRKRIEWQLPLYLLILMLAGLLVLYSATYNERESYLFRRQTIWLIASFVLFFATSIFKRRFWQDIAFPLAIFSIVLLFAVLFTSATGGSNRWLNMGPVNFQPSELAKFALILLLAKLYSLEDRKSFWMGLLIALVMAGLIFKEPDFGTTLIIGIIWITMAFFSKKFDKPLLILITGGILASPLVILFGMRQYQLDRLLSFIFPERYLASSYNSLQAIRAIASGGIAGRGYLQGPMNLYGYVPADPTDFIFSVIGEELGFVGAVLIIILYCLIIWRLWKIATIQKAGYNKLSIAGFMTILAFHLIENVGMNLGLMPVTGIPLPFISYGGSSSLIFAIELGVVYKFANQADE